MWIKAPCDHTSRSALKLVLAWFITLCGFFLSTARLFGALNEFLLVYGERLETLLFSFHQQKPHNCCFNPKLLSPVWLYNYHHLPAVEFEHHEWIYVEQLALAKMKTKCMIIMYCYVTSACGMEGVQVSRQFTTTWEFSFLCLIW